MDLEPRNAATRDFAGRALDDYPAIGSMLARAMTEGKPIASDPINLLRPNGPVGLALAAPVVQDGASTPAGFVTFSYELAPLMLTNDDLSLFSVALKDPRTDDGELIANDRGIVSSRKVAARRTRAVGGAHGDFRQSRLVARLLRQDQCGQARRADRRDRRRDRACADRHRLRPVRLCRLQQFAAQPRNPGADRLRAPADRRDRRAQPPGEEHPRGDPVDRHAHLAPRLRHRCRARTSDRAHSRDVERGLAAQRKPVAGREAEGAVRGARHSACRSHRGERPRHRGQRARRAKPVAAVLRARLAFRRGPVAGRQASAHRREMGGHGRGAEPVFTFRWEEFNTSEATRRPDSDFGLILLDRVAPEALGGTSKRYFTDVSYVYELTAPMETVVDMTERDRTEQISAPVRPSR